MSLSGLYKSSKSGNVLSEQQLRSCPWYWTHRRFQSGNLLSLLRFSAATLGNKCAVWDTWLYLRHYEKLLCGVDSLWQNSGEENLCFRTLFFCGFGDCLSKFYFPPCPYAHSLAVMHACIPSSFPSSLDLMLSVCICARSKYFKNNQSWFDMISVSDDCLMHLHLGNVYQTGRRHEINISARLVFCLYEYFKAELHIQAAVSVRNEALVDLKPAVDMWNSDWFGSVCRTTVDVAALHHGSAVRQKPHTSTVDVLLFLTGIESCFSDCCRFFMTKGPTGTHYKPVVLFQNALASTGISDWMLLSSSQKKPHTSEAHV